MAKYTTYLVGPMQDAKDGGVKWRERITPKLHELDVEVIDPTVTESEEYGSIEEAQKTLKNYVATGKWDVWDAKLDDIIKRDIEAVYASTFIVAFYDPDTKMGGTLCEIWEAAWHRKIPVYVVCHNPMKDWNMWMLRTVRRSGQIFPSWAQLMEFLNDKYGETKTQNKSLVTRVVDVVQEIGHKLSSSK